MAPSLARLVRVARRRMRVNRVLTVAGPALLVTATVALTYVLLGRAVVVPGPESAVALALAVALLLVLAAAALVRIPDRWAAWAADRWLGSRDAYATAVELLERPGPLVGVAARHVEVAEESAAGFRHLPQRPNVPARLLAIGAAVALVALAAGVLPNPQDDVRERRDAEQALVGQQAEALRAAARELSEPGASPERVAEAERLERLAEELQNAAPDEALAALQQARAELATRLAPDLPARRTALAGLAQELARAPLADGASVRAQLDALAAQLGAGQLGQEEAQALAQRLSALSQALSGQPEVAQALAEAGEAAAAGDQAAAGAAAADASAAVATAVGELDGQEARAAADSALTAAADSLRQGQGKGQGQGEGQGQGQGEGQGQGVGGGGANDAGQRSGTSSGGGATGTGQQPDSDLDLQTVYEPPQRPETQGDDMRLPARPDPEQPEVATGSQQAEGLRNAPLVPYRDVLPSYAERATQTVEQRGYPARLRRTVQDYFDRLAEPS